MPRSKYRAVPTVRDGIRFSSKGESERYAELKLQERANEISDLELQPTFQIIVNGVKVCTYKADFRYRNAATGATIVEDHKGFKTPVYRLKKKLIKACYGIDILETGLPSRG